MNYKPLFEFALAGNSPCVLSSGTVSVNFTVTLPQHRNTALLNPQLSDRWHQFATEVALHEQTHVDITVVNLEEFAEVAPTSAANCDQLNSRLSEAWELMMETLNQQQNEFDTEEIARVNNARAPLRSQLADAKRELAYLDTERKAREARITGLASQIDIIEARHGNGIPAAIHGKYSQTVDEHNTLANEFNTLNNDYNAVIARMRRLNEELTWIN